MKSAMQNSLIDRAFIVPGLPHILLGSQKSPAWKSLYESYGRLRTEVEKSDADVILYFSTQWLSVIGYLFQADPKPEWLHVDGNWHEFGSIPYQFKVDPDFAKVYRDEVAKLGHNAACVNYRGFPIDTGTIVAQKLLNPANKIPAAMVSCNMYSEKEEMMQVGIQAAYALQKSGKRAIAVLVSNLSARFFTDEIDPKKDHIHSQKDDEWNRKICELLGEGRLEDVSQCAREFAREAHADMGFKGIWWLNGLCGQTNDFRGEIYDYQPVWGSGAVIASLSPTRPVRPRPLEAQEIDFEGKTKAETPVSATQVHSERAPLPVGPYPHARREGEFIFLSGVGPRSPGSRPKGDPIPGVTLSPKGDVIAYDIEEQTRSVIRNVKSILEDSGSSLDRIVDIQVFLTHMKKDFEAFNRVYADELGTIGATRTTIEVGSLPTQIAVEFKVIARA